MLLRESQTVPLPSIRLPAPVVPAFDLVSDGLVNCATFHCRHFLQSGGPCRDAAISVTSSPCFRCSSSNRHRIRCLSIQTSWWCDTVSPCPRPGPRDVSTGTVRTPQLPYINSPRGERSSEVVMDCGNARGIRIDEVRSCNGLRQHQRQCGHDRPRPKVRTAGREFLFYCFVCRAGWKRESAERWRVRLTMGTSPIEQEVG